MNLTNLASHTVDLDLVPECPTVLDVGCRNFDFSREILRVRPKARVVAMDPDPEMPAEDIPGVLFLREALVGDDRAESNYATYSYGDGNFLCDTAPHYARQLRVCCVSLPVLMMRLNVAYWDVVKLDCEGSEFQILERWPGPIAGQLSIEFHDWTGEWKEKAKDSPTYYPELWAGPLRDYEVVRHELSTVGPGPAWGHWDTVLRLRRTA